jgi:hypothetical protein
MKAETFQRRRTLLWALPASLILHALIAALLVYGVPVPSQPPAEEEPVNVALVPPPDPPKPKPAPTPPPPKPEAESQPEQKVEKPTPEKLPPVDVLKPVFQFGDKDTGPSKSLDGGSAQAQALSPTADNEPEPAAEPKDADGKPVPAPDGRKPAEPAKTDDKPEADKQEAGSPDADKQASAAAVPLAAPEDDGEIELPASAQAPQARPDTAPKPRPAKAPKQGRAIAGEPSPTATSLAYSGLPGVRKLFSKGATGDPFATNSMADVPRDQRVAKLCASVLSQELNDAAYAPQLIPSIPLKTGNILDAPDHAFRTATTWYHVRFRCGIDTNATKVTSFAFRVGAVASPQESALLDQEARRQGFPVGRVQ